jgi:hypothetical protein
VLQEGRIQNTETLRVAAAGAFRKQPMVTGRHWRARKPDYQLAASIAYN